MMLKKNVLTGAYFYPLTTSCPYRRNRAAEFDIQLVDETLLVQQAEPLFPGHDQPKIYCLGDVNITRWDDSIARYMSIQTELAQNFGIDFFIFDTYMGIKNGQFQKEAISPLDDAFLGSDASKKFKFAMMYVMSSPRVIIPAPRERGFKEPGRCYDISGKTAEKIVDTSVMQYWERDNYIHIKDRPYVSLYIPFTLNLNHNNGSARGEKFSEFIPRVKEYALLKYKIEPYLVGVVTSNSHHAKILEELGMDAITSYAFLPDFDSDQPVQDYRRCVRKREKDWTEISGTFSIPYVPPAVTGWDASPRGKLGYNLEGVSGFYPYTPIVTNDSPENFRDMLRKSIQFTKDNVPDNERYNIITAWNEVAEGLALLPRVMDRKADFSYLKQVKSVLEENSKDQAI